MAAKGDTAQKWATAPPLPTSLVPPLLWQSNKWSTWKKNSAQTARKL